MALQGKLLQIWEVNKEQTKNSNHFSLEFTGLDKIVERARTHRFPSVRGLYQGVVTSLRNSRFADDQISGIAKTLELSLHSISSLPDPQIETQAIPRFNDSVRAITKFAEMEDMTVSFFDYVNGSTTGIMELWKAMVGDKFSGAMGFKEEFILPTAYLYTYGPDAPGYEESVPPYLEKRRIVNLFPKQVNKGEFSYESGDARKIEVTFSVDSVYLVQVGTFAKDPVTGNYTITYPTGDPNFDFGKNKLS
jgi:hypothetical protein